MSESKWKTGNLELLKSLEETPFDTHKAEELIRSIEDINTPILDAGGYSTTYLYEAVEADNIAAVELLLRYGADPNYYNLELTSDCALWDLQYMNIPDEDEDSKKEVENRYQIAKLFFQYGADPNLILEGESLYDAVVYSIYNDGITGCWFKLLLNFYKLLIAYGGGGERGYGKPELTQEIDLERIDEYQIRFRIAEDNYHIEGRMYDPDGNEIGLL